MIKSDNSHFKDKIRLREALISECGFQHISALDCCAGSGQIWKLLRRKFNVSSYLGIDKENKAAMVKLDSVRFLREADLTRFNVFDVDTYGSPWKHFDLICKRVESDCLVFLTIGQVMTGIDSILTDSLDIPKRTPQALKATCRLLGEQKLLSRVLDRFTVKKCIEIRPSERIKYIGMYLTY